MPSTLLDMGLGDELTVWHIKNIKTDEVGLNCKKQSVLFSGSSWQRKTLRHFIKHLAYKIQIFKSNKTHTNQTNPIYKHKHFRLTETQHRDRPTKKITEKK